MAASAVVAVLGLGAAVAVATGRDGNGGALASPPATEQPSSTTEACEDLPFQPCGEEPAPNTDGRRCLDGFADFDEDPANGCEAEPDGLPEGTELVDELSANLVPADDVDTFVVDVADNLNFPCDGTLTITLTAPAGVTQRVSLLDGSDEVLGQAVSADGVPGTVSVSEPGGCFGDDAQSLSVRVESVGTERSAEPYLLTRQGDF